MDMITISSPVLSLKHFLKKISWSAPKGPYEEDEWTREGRPVGQAKTALEEFIAFYKDL